MVYVCCKNLVTFFVRNVYKRFTVQGFLLLVIWEAWLTTKAVFDVPEVYTVRCSNHSSPHLSASSTTIPQVSLFVNWVHPTHVLPCPSIYLLFLCKEESKQLIKQQNLYNSYSYSDRKYNQRLFVQNFYPWSLV